MKKGVAVGIGCGVVVLIGLACAGLFGGLAWLGIGMYKDLTGAADSFLGQLGNDDVDGAYASASTTLRQQQTLEQFTKSVKHAGLTDYQSANWTSFNIVNDEGSIEGTMTTKSGGAIPLKVDLIKEGKVWKVSGVTPTGTAGVKPPGGEKPMPSDDELAKLTEDSLLEFNKAVRAKDFTAFHATISELWKRQATPDQLKNSFQVFIDKEIDISPIREVKPIFETKPAIDADGILVLEGYYPTKPLRTTFGLKFTYEHPNWKLVGFRIATQE